MSEIDRIFDDHKRRMDKICDDFEKSSHQDLLEYVQGMMRLVILGVCFTAICLAVVIWASFIR